MLRIESLSRSTYNLKLKIKITYSILVCNCSVNRNKILLKSLLREQELSSPGYKRNLRTRFVLPERISADI